MKIRLFCVAATGALVAGSVATLPAVGAGPTDQTTRVVDVPVPASVAQKVTFQEGAGGRRMVITKPDGSSLELDLATVKLDVTTRILPAGTPETANGRVVEDTPGFRKGATRSIMGRTATGPARATKDPRRQRSVGNGVKRINATACQPENLVETRVGAAGVTFGYVRNYTRWCWSNSPLHVYYRTLRMTSWGIPLVYCTENNSQSWQWDNGTNTPGYFRSYARTNLRGWAPWGCIGPTQNLMAGVRGGPLWAWSAFRSS